MKKIAQLFFILVIISAMTALAVLGASAATASEGTCGAEDDGANLTWTLDDAGTLTISGSGEMKNFEYAEAPWFESYENIKAIVINEGVTTVGNYAFLSCQSAASVSFPDTLTRIGEQAFDSCISLTEITLPESLETLDPFAFVYCDGLTSVNIPANVSYIDFGALKACTALAEITVDEKNENYCSLDGALYSKDMSVLLQYPIGKAETSFTVPEGVKTVWVSAFESDPSLEHVVLPDSLVTIDSFAFQNCFALNSIDIPKNVTTINHGIASNCRSLSEFTVDKQNTVFSSIDGVLFNKEQTVLVQYPKGKEETSYTVPSTVKTIGYEAFGGSNLTEIVLPSSLEAIGGYAFVNCRSLKNIVLPNGLATIDYYAFHNCSKLESIVIPESVSTLSRCMFTYCSSLTSLTVLNPNIAVEADLFSHASEDLVITCYQGSAIDTYALRDGIAVEYIPNSSVKQLATPQNLTWNKNEGGETAYGWISWDVVDNCEGEYEIIIYNNGKEVFHTSWSGLYDDGLDRVGCEAIHESIFNESGNFTFTVKAIGDGTNYSDSDTAVSEVYAFTVPKAKLAVPENLVWARGGVLTHDSVENAGGYLYRVYGPSGDEIGATWSVDTQPDEYNGTVTEDLTDYIEDMMGWTDKEEMRFLQVSVTALTYNIELYQNSDESEKSSRYMLGQIEDSFIGEIQDVIGNIEDGELPSAALDNFFNYMEEKDLNNTDMAISMQGSDFLVDKIAEFEEAYQEETNVAVTINDTAEDNTYLEDRGIDIDKISIVGAALNSKDGSDVSLNFSEPDPTISPDETFYKNSVAVNIDMDGVNDSQSLDIPVQITMPIPANVLASRLVILHYHKDGSVETIDPSVVYIDNVPYAKFVLTQFSTFVFCNEIAVPGDVNGDGEITVRDAALILQFKAGWNVDIDENAADVNDDGEISVRDAALILQYKAGWNVTLK